MILNQSDCLLVSDIGRRVLCPLRQHSFPENPRFVGGVIMGLVGAFGVWFRSSLLLTGLSVGGVF